MNFGGLFAMFGPSRDIQRLDGAVRAAGMHPALMTQAVKLTILRLLKANASGAAGPSEHDMALAADLVVYCLNGAEDFSGTVGEARLQAVEARITRAIEQGEGTDTDLILLTLGAGLIHPAVVEAFGLEMG